MWTRLSEGLPRRTFRYFVFCDGKVEIEHFHEKRGFRKNVQFWKELPKPPGECADWIRFLDRKPKKDGRYLVYHGGGYDIARYKSDIKSGFRKSEGASFDDWYWMPLPSSPLEQEANR